MTTLSALSGKMRRPMEDYKGRGCACAPGTHATLVSLLTSGIAKPDAGCLDIGAHAGALLMRLSDAGFKDLTGSDLDVTRFNVPGAKFLQVELNRPFSESFGRKFDVITCTDVIEHLDSPRNFITECWKLLNPGGVLAISMPNVAFWEGRLKFLLKGELWGFGDRNYRLQRHISPVTREQLALTLQELGFEPVDIRAAGSFATTMRRIVLSPLWLPFRIFGGSDVMGECLIAVSRKARPDPDLKRPLHYRQRWQGQADSIGIEHLAAKTVQSSP